MIRLLILFLITSAPCVAQTNTHLFKSTVRFTNVQVFPDLKSKTARIKMSIINDGVGTDAYVMISAESYNSTTIQSVTPVGNRFILPAKDSFHTEMTLNIGRQMLLWDEFDPNLYRLTATLNAGTSNDTARRQFGMRDFTKRADKFTINDRNTFLRGSVIANPANSVNNFTESMWVKLFRSAREYGLNNIRFAGWCPAEAAFNAADRIGIYLQVDLDDSKKRNAEMHKIIQQFGDHPSFCILTTTNSSVDFTSQDNRRLYHSSSLTANFPNIVTIPKSTTGASQSLHYKMAIEKHLANSTIGGFQLPGLQELPLKNLETINIIDASMMSETMAVARKFRRFSGSSILLAQLNKTKFSPGDQFNADIQMNHFAKDPISNVIVTWTVKDRSGKVIQSGQFNPPGFGINASQVVGQVNFTIPSSAIPGTYTLEVLVQDTVTGNDWSFEVKV